MKKRSIVVIICVILLLVGGFVWAATINQQSQNDTSKAPTDEEKIMSIANNDPAASEQQLTASTVRIEKTDGNWYLATITYRSATSGMYAAYPTVLLHDSGGGFSIITGFNNPTSDEYLTTRGIPKVIRDAIVRPGKESVEGVSP